MNTWRARRVSVKLNRRRSVSITVRRFRLAKKTAQAGVVFNIHLGRIRQISIVQITAKRPRRVVVTAQRFQSVLPSVCIVLGFVAIVYSTAVFTKPRTIEPVRTYATVPSQLAATAPVTMPRSTPTHITIDSQHIDVDLIPVGLAEDGSIELPPVLEWIAGWYNLSPTPGELGPSVIVGHVDSYEGVSVFWDLRYVQAGDVIAVTRADGSIARFQVTQLAQYDQSNFPTQLVYGNTDDAQLRVITCGGTFDASTHNYSQNTVVYAKLISSQV